jgi:hypothetical protein
MSSKCTPLIPSVAALASASAVALSCAVAGSAAAVVVVDPSYTNGPGDIYNSNGSFEFGPSGNELTSDNATAGFWQTGDGVGTNVVESIQTRDNLLASEGSHSLVMGAEGGGDVLGGLLNTNYVVQDGDILDLSFDWLAAQTWDATGDSFEYYLFTTSDNTLGGTKTTLLSGSVSGNPSTYQTVDPADEVVAPLSASIGQQLWIEFSSNPNANAEFARLDNVQLEVIPEPASIALLAAGGALMLTRRRR